MTPMMGCLWNSYGCFASGLDLDLDLWIYCCWPCIRSEYILEGDLLGPGRLGLGQSHAAGKSSDELPAFMHVQCMCI